MHKYSLHHDKQFLAPDIGSFYLSYCKFVKVIVADYGIFVCAHYLCCVSKDTLLCVFSPITPFYV